MANGLPLAAVWNFVARLCQPSTNVDRFSVLDFPTAYPVRNERDQPPLWQTAVFGSPYFSVFVSQSIAFIFLIPLYVPVS